MWSEGAGSAWCQIQQPLEIPIHGKRKVDNGLRLDLPPCVRPVRLQQRGLRGYNNLLRHVADFERQIDSYGAVDQHIHTLANKLSESRLRGGYVIGAGGQI